MKKDLKLIDQLRNISATDLIKMLSDDYYRTMIGCRKEDANSKIMDLIDEALEVEVVAVSLDVERYDLGVILRDWRVSLADRIVLDA